MASSGQHALEARRRGKRKAGKAAEQTTYGDTVDSIESMHEGVSRTTLQVPFVSNPANVKDYNQDSETSKREHLDAEAPEKDLKDKKLTQNRQFLDEYKTDADLLSVCDMALNTDVTLGKICGCGKGIIEVQCKDCLEYRATCRQCWVQEHSRYMWWHWALVWNRDGDFFQRYDFSHVLDPMPAIQLGHHGNHCPNPTNGILLVHIHVNGIHTSRFQFCHCQAIPEGLPYKEEDVSKQLRRAFRVWNLIKTNSRLGQNHGIDNVLTRWPPGNLVVWCTVCPEPGFNMEKGWEKTSKQFMHLNQLNLLLNGNFHANKLKKKPESDDISLFEGRAYYPEEKQYQEYLRVTLPSAEKSVCNNLKVVNTQNRRKFKTMEVMGMVNCTCNHVCIFGTVDLHLGEQFRNTDAALLQALKLCMHSQEKNDLGVAFNGVCACLETMCYMIPDLHVQGQKDDCIYLYGSGYFQCNGHNHGEGIEQYWAVINALGPQIRQMNNGYQQDTLIIHHGDHNWKKTYTQAYRLVIELEDGKYLYRKKRDFYKAHSAYCREQYPEAFEEWQKVDCYKTYKDSKDIVSPFCFHSKQFPSLKSVITRMATITTTTEELFKKKVELALRKDDKSSAEEVTQEETPSIPSAHATMFLYEGILLEIDQEAPNPEIGEVWDKIFETSVPVPETCKLLLPSAMSPILRQKMGFTNLVAEEYELREGAAYDSIAEVRLRASTVAYMDETRQGNDMGQERLTKSLRQLNNARESLELAIQQYNGHQMAMKELGVHSGSSFPLPELSMQDTYRKTRTRKRAMGDSRVMDGRIFGNITRKKPQGIWKKKNQEKVSPQDNIAKGSGEVSDSNTSQDVKSTAKRHKTLEKGTSDEGAKTEGWIWNLYKIRHPGMTDEDVEGLEQEGDRVTFFRAEAEKDRWLEQWEIKIAEFLRCIWSFDQYTTMWKALATTDKSLGFKQYALEKANMYTMLGARAKQEFETLGYGNVLNRPTDQTLEDFMLAQRLEYEDEPDDWEEREEARNKTKPKTEAEIALIFDDGESDEDQEIHV
ncbi:hypothetical protein IW261DRAFT_1572702 [Armillaria novae-zelandiae]|uniref:CxC2-like cysteine cluster KDZ transposase-associated domain-containing protein n=1 Tax=Armillaria novae-zelandiae TaxID=153914 RepID=A0AA39NS69_9AGAR|nr:hypothetical protein IW261DRAFT_1572702 [Armillaria novae-zelandiae]